MKDIKEFLLKNGFTQTDRIRFINDKCIVIVDEETNCYEIKFEVNDDQFTCFSQSLNMYWLIGFLTYNNLMDKNYSVE